jgi:hypothetical protein
MRLWAGILLLAFAPVIATHQRVLRDNTPPYPPAAGEAKFIADLAPGPRPASLQELCAASLLVADAHIQSVYPASVIGRHLETDSVLLISQLFKGREDHREVVVSQMGGVLGAFRELTDQYALVQQGEHYIVFLDADPRPQIPDRGAPRYGITGVWSGLLKVVEDKIHLPPASSLQAKYEGMNVEQVRSELGSCR